jgi:hypothetical protein
MGKVLLVSETTHRRPEQKEVNVLKRTSNKNMREAQRIPVLLCHEKCYHGPDTQNYTAEKVSSDGKSAIGFRETSGESRRRTYYKKKAQGIRSNQHCRIAEKTLRQKVRRSTDSYALMRREMLLCMLVCDAMLSCNETSSKRLQPSLLARRHYCLTLEVDL